MRISNSYNLQRSFISVRLFLFHIHKCIYINISMAFVVGRKELQRGVEAHSMTFMICMNF